MQRTDGTSTYAASDPTEARRRYGGMDLPATFGGFLAAIGAFLILTAIAGAIVGSVGIQTGIEGNATELSIGGLVTGLVVLFLGFLIGGWVAGRMARYDGGRNGLMTALWAILLVAILGVAGAILGDRYDVTQGLNLPRFFSSDALTTAGIVSGLASLVVMLIGGFLGGLWGSAYHRRVDRAMASAPVVIQDQGTVSRDEDTVVSRETGQPVATDTTTTTSQGYRTTDR